MIINDPRAFSLPSLINGIEYDEYYSPKEVEKHQSIGIFYFGLRNYREITSEERDGHWFD